MEANPITPELLTQAVETAHDTCTNDCIHADAMQAIESELGAKIGALIVREITAGRDPIFSIFFYGLHVGYRLSQLVSTPLPSDKVN